MFAQKADYILSMVGISLSQMDGFSCLGLGKVPTFIGSSYVGPLTYAIRLSGMQSLRLLQLYDRLHPGRKVPVLPPHGDHHRRHASTERISHHNKDACGCLAENPRQTKWAEPRSALLRVSSPNGLWVEMVYPYSWRVTLSKLIIQGWLGGTTTCG